MVSFIKCLLEVKVNRVYVDLDFHGPYHHLSVGQELGDAGFSSPEPVLLVGQFLIIL